MLSNSKKTCTLRNKENRQNVYNVTKDPMNDVRRQGQKELESINNAIQKGRDVRDNVDKIQANNSKTIDKEVENLNRDGNKTREKFVQNQKKGVLIRLGAKGAKEAKGSVKDVKDFFSGESQQG
jgi:hypothetical protein